VVIKTNEKPEIYRDYLFSTIKGDKDQYLKEEICYFIGKRKKEKIGTIYRFALKAGRYFYHFIVERYLIDDKNVIIKTQQIKKEDNDILYPDLLLAIIPYKCSRNDFYVVSYWNTDVCKDQIINLPILKDTVIPGYVSAKDIFFDIYSYLSSKKEIKIEDNRSDIMKLESAGFDKIVSFRNIK
jgi:hypothetical protein